MAASSGRRGRSPISALPPASASPAAAGSPSTAVVLSTPLPTFGKLGDAPNDEAIWKRLKEAGFDEESIRRRDKAALIAYIAKLEGELYDYQHNMGLLLLERKDQEAKYDQAKAAADSAEAMLKRDQATHASTLAEIKKREESLKKALGIEKECVANIEKALHETRKECAEIKLDAENKLADARKMIEDAEKKYLEANSKQHLADSLQAEASRHHSAAERKLIEVEAREDEIRRRYNSLKFEYEAKEKEVCLERKHIYEHQKAVQHEEDKLFEKQSLLNQREQLILSRSVELDRLEKELEETRLKIKEDLLMLREEKSNLQLKTLALESREKALFEKEVSLDEKEKALLTLQGKIKSKEFDEIQRLKDEYHAAFENKKAEIEAELELKRKLLDEEMEARRQACQLMESNIKDREEQVKKMSDEIELKVNELKKKENDVEQTVALLTEKEQKIIAAKERVDKDKDTLKKERDDIMRMKIELEELKSLHEFEEKRAFEATKSLKITESERDDLMVMQIKLKEELDGVRAQRMQLMAEAEQLKAEKDKFETEWQLIDEKRDELRNEAERIAEERKIVSKFLKDEKDHLKLEKDLLREQFKQDVDSLACEREAFINKMDHEHAEWISKIQQERADFIQGIELQKKELEDCIERKQSELERNLREKEDAFELEKAKSFELINSQKELVAKELEHVASHMKKLEEERTQIVLDREKREKEWTEVYRAIDELQIQRERLQEQREMLHKEKEEISLQIKQLNELEALKRKLENMEDQVEAELPYRDTPGKRLAAEVTVCDAEKCSGEPKEVANDGLSLKLVSRDIGLSSPSVSTPVSWFKKCAQIIFKHHPEKDLNCETNGEDQIFSEHLEQFRSNSNGSTKEMIYEIPSANKNGDVVDSLEIKGFSNKMKVAHHKESFLDNLNNAKARSAGDGSKSFLGGRKRNGHFSSQDHVDASIQKYKRRREGQAMSVGLIKDTCDRVGPTSSLKSEDGLDLRDQSSGARKEESVPNPPQVGTSHSEDEMTKPLNELYFKAASELIAESCGELNDEEGTEYVDVIEENEEEPKTTKEKLWTFLVT